MAWHSIGHMRDLIMLHFRGSCPGRRRWTYIRATRSFLRGIWTEVDAARQKNSEGKEQGIDDDLGGETLVFEDCKDMNDTA